MNSLPLPDSDELKALLPSSRARHAYNVLYKNQDRPITILEIRRLSGLPSETQEHLNRGVRDLYKVFEVERTQKGSTHYYRLIKEREAKLNTVGINNKVRAQVLAPARCAQCGRTPLQDGVKLDVDHKIPQNWGGTNDIENLQPLCEQCNNGKRDFYATYDKYAEQIKAAANYDEPHKRIGELLKAFNGKPVPSDLLEVVANSKQYQEDWQKRMRELRELGWQYSFSRKKTNNRIKTFFTLERYEPWPEGNIRVAIKQREIQKKLVK